MSKKRRSSSGVWVVAGLAVAAVALLIGLSLRSAGPAEVEVVADSAMGAKRSVWGPDSAKVKLVEFGDYL